MFFLKNVFPDTIMTLTFLLASVESIVLKVCTGLHGSQRMNPKDASSCDISKYVSRWTKKGRKKEDEPQTLAPVGQTHPDIHASQRMNHDSGASMRPTD